MVARLAKGVIALNQEIAELETLIEERFLSTNMPRSS
jgi:hypothetical protein